MVRVPTPDQLQEARDRLRSRPLPQAMVLQIAHGAHGHHGQISEEVASAATESCSKQGHTAQEVPFRITVRFMDGNDWEFDVRSSDRVHVMRSELAAKLGVGAPRLKLTFGDALLQVDDVMCEVGVTEGAVVNVIVLPPLYRGSEIYNEIAANYARQVKDHMGDHSEAREPKSEEMHDVLEDLIAKRAAVNESFAQFARLRLRRPCGT